MLTKVNLFVQCFITKSTTRTTCIHNKMHTTTHIENITIFFVPKITTKIFLKINSRHFFHVNKPFFKHFLCAIPLWLNITRVVLTHLLNCNYHISLNHLDVVCINFNQCVTIWPVARHHSVKIDPKLIVSFIIPWSVKYFNNNHIDYTRTAKVRQLSCTFIDCELTFNESISPIFNHSKNDLFIKYQNWSFHLKIQFILEIVSRLVSNSFLYFQFFDCT